MGLDMYLYGVQYRSRFENDVNKTQIVHTQEVYWRKSRYDSSLVRGECTGWL